MCSYRAIRLVRIMATNATPALYDAALNGARPLLLVLITGLLLLSGAQCGARANA
jgi:hypothetical protein